MEGLFPNLLRIVPPENCNPGYATGPHNIWRVALLWPRIILYSEVGMCNTNDFDQTKDGKVSGYVEGGHVMSRSPL